ncbi:hypothetical protein A6X20_07295 [Bradyrhizobium elkanii]|nr:hypothetical protein A6X20_07295 [Bradyrhizobium elkanii]ODM79112.1 hypothetical protein A6452_28880 [Bradyrhizobium elkanii]
MTRSMTLEEAAAELHKTPRWLREWVRARPRDKLGEPFYTPVGRDKLFEPSDIARIKQALREELKCPSNSGRRGPAKRRTLKSAAPTDESMLKLAAELTGDPTLLKSLSGSKVSSTSTDNTPHQKPRLRLV